MSDTLKGITIYWMWKKIGKTGSIKRGEDGKFYAEGNVSSHLHPNHAAAIVDYYNCLTPLFEKAQAASDFEFILTLLNIRGVQDAGWDPYENTTKIFDSILSLRSKAGGVTEINLLLWLYAHIIEASEPYEMIANLLNVSAGERYRAFNFPKKGKKWKRQWYPGEKIAYLEELATQVGMLDAIKPIKEIFDRNLRNAVYHSNYTVYQNEVRTIDPERVYSFEEWRDLVNKAIAYQDVLTKLIADFKASYSKSEVIDTTPGFGSPDEKAVVIVREKEGVIGLKDNWVKEEIVQQGKIPFLLIRSMAYERILIQKNHTHLPKNRVDQSNKILSKLPKFLARRLVKIFERFLIMWAQRQKEKYV